VFGMYAPGFFFSSFVKFFGLAIVHSKAWAKVC
jgi:hypothetical protein